MVYTEVTMTEQLFWTDKPGGAGSDLKAPCAMNAMNNILQTELFSSCNVTRQLRSHAFAQRFLDRYPNHGDVLARVQRKVAGREGGGLAHFKVEHFLRAMGYQFHHVNRIGKTSRPGFISMELNFDIQSLIPSWNTIMDLANEHNAFAVQIAMGQGVPRPGKNMHAHHVHLPTSTRSVTPWCVTSRCFD